MRGIAIVVVIFCTALVQARPQAGGEKKEQANYYPLKEGSKWQYSVDVPGQPAQKFVFAAAKSEKIDGVTVFTVETSTQDKVVATEQIGGSDRGVFRYSFNGEKPTNPVYMIKYPVKPGEKWEDETEVLGEKMKISYKVGNEEEAKVNAGKFKAIPIHVDTEFQGTKIITTYWFAANVGVVKQIAEVGGVKVTMELEKYEAAK